MEPRIQYAQTADGVSIAFWVVGRGPPFVWVPEPPWSHIQLEWREPVFRKSFDLLATKRSVVRFDARGLGLSDRDVDDLSLDSRILDLEAVVDSLRYQTFALCAVTWATPLAIAYAARHSERVSHLILVSAMASAMDAMRVPRQQTLRTLLDSDWELYTENVAAVSFGWGREEARRFADHFRACVSADTGRRYFHTMQGDDVTEYLPQVTTPTLLVQLTGVSYLSIDSARKLASGMPNAQMVAIEGNFSESLELVLAAIDDFLSEGDEAAAGVAPSGLVTILFTDMEGSTTLTQRLGDAKAQEVLRAHNRIVRDALKAHSGSEIKHTGDGIMASFASASRALECAIDIQRALAQHNESNPDMPIRVRIGLNAGEPVAEEKDLFGTAVQLAARICAHAEPGEILAPIVVRELAAGKGFLLSDRGDVALRGFEDPVRLYEVRWREEG
ncbi:MAG: adenylate/guanylate cyclase domain-containing protein [Dehalococcoidia bacterium]|nr:MAG: adenylate/guanylate cyclase domain-containing protein [Dehalococcoidia bacterium]